MRKEKFTQLPWRIEAFRDFISIMAGYSEICYIDGDLKCDNVQANARLCAVAPEMYLLLQMLFDEIRRNIWSDQRQKLYMERIIRVQTWALNGRERERE